VADWEVDSGELAASASKVGAEAQTLAGLARDVEQVLVEAPDFDNRDELADRYTRVVSTHLAAHLRSLAEEAGSLARDVSVSAQAYDTADEDAARLAAGKKVAEA
jgi:hypothetical protein